MLIEIARGNAANRGLIIEHTDILKYIKPGEELYRSYFGFDEKIKEHINSGRKTPSGFIGNFFINQIILDIDKGSDTFEHTINRLKDFVNRLIKEFELENNFQTWFSGTGFHIHIPNIFNFQPSNNLPNVVKVTIENYFPEVDTKPIHARGLIRVGRTINLKSHLYKIPIKESEIWFLTEEQLKGWAVGIRLNVKPIKYDTPSKIFSIIEPRAYVEPLIKVIKPNSKVTCMQHCYNSGEVFGTRHNRIIAMSSWLHREGIPLKGTIVMMKSYAPNLDSYEVEKVVTDLYLKGGYNYGCESSVMKEFCDSQCMFYKKKNYLPEIFGSEEIEKEYKLSMEKGWKETSLNLAPFFGIETEKGYWLRPGHVIGIIADTGMSKSALMQNISLQFKNFGKTLFINTEMPYEELYERFVQIEYSMTNEQVREHYIEKDASSLKHAIKHIEYIKSTPNYDGIVDLVHKLQPKILIIDVIDDISPGKDRSINNQEDMYSGIKQITRDYKCITFMVHHINKDSAIDDKGKNKSLNVHSAKGSSAFEQKCDIVIGIEGNQLTGYRTVKSLKGRSTSPFITSFYVDPNTFKYHLQKLRSE